MKTYTFFAGYTNMIFRIKKQTEHFITFDYVYDNDLDSPDWFYNVKCKVKDNKFTIKRGNRTIWLDDYFFKEINEIEYRLEYENDEKNKQIIANRLEIKRLKAGCV
tara:strand:- start:6578 stop:6895 length:318 start_codon:yes stop_codon:yes gene_type:complete